MGQILLIGEDDSLLMARAAVLRKTQAQAVQLALSREPFQFDADDAFDVIVICNSVALSGSERLIERVRQNWPKAYIFEMLRLGRSADDSAADFTIPACKPDLLVMRVSEALEGRLPRPPIATDEVPGYQRATPQSTFPTHPTFQRRT
jgi:hypothetical protein